LAKSIQWPDNPTKQMTLEEYRETAKSQSLVALNDTIYDVSSFTTSHPGGQALILSAVGQEPTIVQQLMASKHTHTKASQNYLSTLAVAKLIKSN